MTVCPPHRWRVESPHGEFSPGVCVHCGETRQFRNWEPDISALYAKQAAKKKAAAA